MSVAAAVAPYGMTTLFISKSARLFCRRKASFKDDELADWVSREGLPGFERAHVTERPRCRPPSPKRRLRRKASATRRSVSCTTVHINVINMINDANAPNSLYIKHHKATQLVTTL